MRLQRYAFGGAVALPRRPSPVADPLDAAALRVARRAPAECARRSPRNSADRGDARALAGRPSERWAAVRARLAPSLARVRRRRGRARSAGIPDREPGYLGIDAAMLRAALRYGGRLRARYTVVDFLEGQGVVEEALDAGAVAPATSGRGRARGCSRSYTSCDAGELLGAQRRQAATAAFCAHLLGVARARGSRC